MVIIRVLVSQRRDNKAGPGIDGMIRDIDERHAATGGSRLQHGIEVGRQFGALDLGSPDLAASCVDDLVILANSNLFDAEQTIAALQTELGKA